MESHIVLVLFSGVLLCLTGCLNGEEESIKQEIATYNEPYELQCDIVGDEINIVWKKEEVIITGREKKKLHEVFETNNTLRVIKVVPGQSGIYVCFDPVGNKSQSFNIVVRPFVQEFDKSKNVIQADPLTLVCTAWAVPELTISWFHNDVKLLPEEGRIVFKNASSTQSSTFPTSENETLVVYRMDYEDAGNYSCVATNELGTANATVLVQVKDKYAALWPFLGICAEVAILCTIILIYEKRRTKRLEEEERQEEAAHLNVKNDTKTPAADDIRQRK